MSVATPLFAPVADSARLPGVEIDDLMDASALSGLQKYVLVLCALAVMCDGFSLQDLALTVPALTKAWGIAPASLSVALSASLDRKSVV